MTSLPRQLKKIQGPFLFLTDLFSGKEVHFDSSGNPEKEALTDPSFQASHFGLPDPWKLLYRP
jgi:hypothetical protein